MQTTSVTLPSPPAPKRKTGRRQPKPAQTSTAAAEPMDTFNQESQAQQERHLRMEHRAQLEAQDRLHKDRISAMFAQLHSQLFAIWNEVWLQRQKVHNEAFESWLKLLIS
jgi:hypothetical protein